MDQVCASLEKRKKESRSLTFREFLIIERKMSEELAVCSLRWDLVSGFPRFVLVLDFFE